MTKQEGLKQRIDSSDLTIVKYCHVWIRKDHVLTELDKTYKKIKYLEQYFLKKGHPNCAFIKRKDVLKALSNEEAQNARIKAKD